MARILIVEDEERIASFVAKGLAADGHRTTVVADGREGLDHALSGDFDLMVLDIGLPGIDGFEVLDQLRSQGSKLPVIVLTARDSVTDTVSALEGGADDYMPKPFRFAELLARIRLRLRTAPDGGPARDDVLEAGGVRLDVRTRRATVGERELDLSAREFSLAEILMINAGQVLSREQLLDQVWGFDFDPGSNVVDVYVGYLRKKFGATAIATVRGHGLPLQQLNRGVVLRWLRRSRSDRLETSRSPRWEPTTAGRACRDHRSLALRLARDLGRVRRQPDSRVSDPRRGCQAWVPSLRSRGRVDSPGEGQRRAGYRVAAGGLAAVLRWLRRSRSDRLD